MVEKKNGICNHLNFIIMIAAEIILDKRYKGKKGYPIKIRVYDSFGKEKKVKHQYIKLNLYQDKDVLQ